MHANVFDRYQAGASSIHRLDPRVKVVVTVLFVVSNVALPDGAWAAFLLSWALVLMISGLAGLGVGYPVRRSFIALPFALAAVSAIVAIPGRPLGAWTVGPWHLVATDAGLLRFASIVVRSWISVQIAVHDAGPDSSGSARSSAVAQLRSRVPGALNIRRTLSARSRSPRTQAALNGTAVELAKDPLLL